jgi:predicted dehydrogenase
VTVSATGIGAIVVGTGFGCFTHVRALRAAGIEVRAVVGTDPEKTAERAGRFDVPLALTSLDEALSLRGVDVITIATPPHTHAELALAAIAAGRHVICEKPFTRDADEGRRVLAAAEHAGIVHLIGTEFRWDPGQAMLARAIADGAVGEPRLATFVLHVPLLADPAAEVPRWWADAADGGGWLGAHGSQVIDQIRVTLGDFEAVSATLPHVGARLMSAEDTFVVHFRLASGAVGILQSTAGDWGPPIVITRVTGSTGTAWIEGVGATVRVADRHGTRTLAVDDSLRAGPAPPLPEGVVRSAYERMISHGLDLGPYTRLAETMRDRILGRTVSTDIAPATFVDGVAHMAVLDAVRRSAAERSWVSVAPVRPAP